MKLSDEDRRSIGLWAADCAERVLPLYEAKVPEDARPRDALDGIRAFGRGGKRTAKLRTLAWAALAAAREVDDPIAAAAARAAGLAAATAYTHALADVHQAKHILGPPAYAAWARELAGDAADDETSWAIEHAPTAVRDVLRQMPARAAGRGRLNALLYQLDRGLRGRAPAARAKRAPSRRTRAPSRTRR